MSPFVASSRASRLAASLRAAPLLAASLRAAPLLAASLLAATLAAASLVVGCGGAATPYSLEVGSDDGGGRFDMGSGGDASVGSLSVSVAANASAVCPGQCVTLSAHAAEGRAPYTYRWDHDLSPAAGDVTACPVATTTYAVIATDSSGESAGELQSASLTGSAHVTVTVTAKCSDAGAPVADAGGPSGPGLRVVQPINAPWTGLTVGILQGTAVYWADWRSMGTGTVSGVLSPPSGAIQVTYTGADLWGAQTTTGSSYWSPASTYTSATVSSAPPGPGIIEINGGAGQMDSLTFSQPVTNPLIAIVSLGTGYLNSPVELDFGAPTTVLSFGPDSYEPTSAGTLTATDGGVSGVEGSGVVQVEGTF